ncbi:hypothetical protein SEA_EVILGENIUS_64 [Mycobacterium phage EvilGenius]|uniref:Uncharacterized protein n=1 Tax=Mycobacterium phage EvilGenius TaxID=1821723 RepID=A0A143FQQ3_9CAUD|nr:hypothetical protein SEA_EVILGENIUS_64 [Mycobacterium phage EvilGenius]AMW64141.1 hypothetical protein SEA_EVILGENIUS_64 [Mycobacterium phage EvilGenius]AMW64321.1 hypothetical protein SEA_CHIPMUNK_65 [Mycobacterium phage ChipMunk]QKY78854.1 hypothetical protein KINGCYRUS_64 [Mycobacterium phage KingCyrus]
MDWMFDGLFFVLWFIIWPLVMLSWGLFLLERRKEVKGGEAEESRTET